jgi:phosphoribosylglycinamide formyltransferase-1
MSGAKPPIVVFAYAFAHRKTQDFLLELLSAGYRQISVIAAPWAALPHRDDNCYFPTTLQHVLPRPAHELCEVFGLRYVATPHDDHAAIKSVVEEAGARLGIIAGARILRRAVVDLFAEGVVNFHPGKLPETAGLDAFFYSLKRNVPFGVTAHFIDGRVDAGMQLFFEETSIGPTDSPEAVLHNNYQSQIKALRRFLDLLQSDALSLSAVDRPYRNMPMEPDQKRLALASFAEWRAARLNAQRATNLLSACEQGDLSTAATILAEDPQLIEHRSQEGWTPLIIAAYSQHLDLVRSLLKLGADPNATGRNGTTPLMYAKTGLLHNSAAGYELLEILLNAGADLRRQDRHGRDILDYASAAGDVRMLEWLNSRSGAL